MPPSTANLVPVIVYVPPWVKELLDADAAENGSNASAEVRRHLIQLLRPRLQS